VHGCTGVTGCEEVFTDQNSGGDLNNNAGPVSPNPEYSWQNNVTLAGNSSVTINRRLMIITTATGGAGGSQQIPTLPLGALILLTGLLTAVVYRRRKSKS
jgi:hypothetical protein